MPLAIVMMTYHGGKHAEATSVGPGARVVPGPSLQPPYRKNLHSLDQALHPLSRQAAPQGDGCGRDQRVFELAGDLAEGGGVHPEPGVERAGLSLPPGVENRSRRFWRGGPGEKVAATAGGLESQRGAGGLVVPAR